MTPQTLYCQKCSSQVTEAHTDNIGTQFYKCPKCNYTTKTKNTQPLLTQQQNQDNTSTKNPQILEHINNIENPQFTGKPVTIQAVISSTSTAYTIPSTIKADIHEEDQISVTITPNIPLDDPINLSLTAITEETKNIKLGKYLKNSYPTAKIYIKTTPRYRQIYSLRVRPPVFTLEKINNKLIDDKGYEYKHLDLYVISDTQLNFQPSTLTNLTGIPLPNPKTQKTTILVYHANFPEDNLNFDATKLTIVQTKFQGKGVGERLNWIIDNFELYSHVVGRRNIAKAAFLGYFSPLHVKFNDQLQRGWAIINIVGDTTTGKSETVKKLSALLKAGMVISAETASTVGLTGTAQQTDKDGWFIDWGFLPLMDRKLLAIDGSHKLGPSCWAALAEAERSGILSIAKAAKNNTYARTRQIKIYNPVDREADRYSTKSLGSFLHPVQALTTILDPTSIARIDLCVFSDQRDVTPELINKKIIASAEPELEYLSEVLKWAWSGKAQIEWTDEAVALLLLKATELYNTFFLEAIPLVSIDVKYKIARLSVALAQCTLSTNEAYSVVWVTGEHVGVIVDFLVEEYTHAGLGLLAQEYKFEKLSLEDVTELILRVQGQLAKNPIENLVAILCFIVTQGHTTCDELKAKFDLVENNQVRPLMAILKTEGLLSVKRGYYPSPKLIEAYKITEGFTMTSDFNGINGFNGLRIDTLSPELFSKEQSLQDRGGGGLVECEAAKSVKTVGLFGQQVLFSRVCGDCARFHTIGCQHSLLAKDPKLVRADCSWACECNDWLECVDSKSENSLVEESC
jgi:hypothetical protein